MEENVYYNMIKMCTRCGKEFPATEEYFYKQGGKRKGLDPSCKKCKEYNKQYREKNKEKISNQRKQYREKNREKISNQRKQYREKNKEYFKCVRIKTRYNLTEKEYIKMVLEQDNKCAICGKEMKIGKGGRSIDHCHSTSRVRGILCMTCNTTLGILEKNDILDKMTTYLEKNKI